MEIELRDLPFPPSVNNCYYILKKIPYDEFKLVIQKAKEEKLNVKQIWDELRKIYSARLVSTKELNYFKAAFRKWEASEWRYGPTVKAEILGMGKVWVSLDLIFWVRNSDVEGADGRQKVVDTSNRIKALEDAIMTLIGIDDSNVWEVRARRAILDDKDENHCSAKITIHSGKPGIL